MEQAERAITECISEGILADFLRKNRAEVVKVSIFEYDKEKEEKKLRKAEFEYGREKRLQTAYFRHFSKPKNQPPVE